MEAIVENQKNLSIKPTKTRYVDILHTGWDLSWKYQWPESIGCREGWIMDCQEIRPSWKQAEDGSWNYSWTSDNDYVREQKELRAANPEMTEKKFIPGVTVEAKISIIEEGLKMDLSITNQSGKALHGVSCDGGCLQALGDPFAGEGEIERTFIAVSGKPRSLARIDRSIPVRCLYVSDQREYEQPPLDEGEYFWGRSSLQPDVPVILGMESHEGNKAVAVGFQGADAGAANADSHHCIHSRPGFGRIDNGQTVSRRGYLLFDRGISEAFGKMFEHLDLKKSDPGRSP